MSGGMITNAGSDQYVAATTCMNTPFYNRVSHPPAICMFSRSFKPYISSKEATYGLKNDIIFWAVFIFSFISILLPSNSLVNSLSHRLHLILESPSRSTGSIWIYLHKSQCILQILRPQSFALDFHRHNFSIPSRCHHERRLHSLQYISLHLLLFWTFPATESLNFYTCPGLERVRAVIGAFCMM